MTEPNENLELDRLLADLRAQAADGQTFLSALAVRLEGALPGRVRIERGGGLLARSHPVKRIEIILSEHKFSLFDEGHGRLAASRTRIVRNIALATEKLSIDAWLQTLVEALRTDAEQSGRGFGALERLLLGP